MANSAELAQEIVRVSDLSTLTDAARSETLTDVLGAHESVLRARLGGWDELTESCALKTLRTAIEDALDDDATEEDLIAYIERIG